MLAGSSFRYVYDQSTHPHPGSFVFKRLESSIVQRSESYSVIVAPLIRIPPALFANMFCAISGEPPSVPVLSIKSGHLYEKRLILKYLSENAGKDPITGEELDAERDLVDVKSGEFARCGQLNGKMERDHWKDEKHQTKKYQLEAVEEPLGSAYTFGTDPECEEVEDDVVLAKRREADNASLHVTDTKVAAPRPPQFTSIPSLLSSLQNEYDSIIFEMLSLKKQYDSVRQELASALYTNDAANRVIARLMKERDEARE